MSASTPCMHMAAERPAPLRMRAAQGPLFQPSGELTRCVSSDPQVSITHALEGSHMSLQQEHSSPPPHFPSPRATRPDRSDGQAEYAPGGRRGAVVRWWWA